MEPIFCWFTQQFHEEQSTEAYSLWRRNNKTVCRLKSMKELPEEEVVNCTTTLEREDLNKWSHDQNEWIRMKRRSNKPHAKKLLLVKETVIR